MRTRSAGALCSALLALGVGTALAETPVRVTTQTTAGAPTPAASASTPVQPSAGPRRDPAGVRGISPLAEAILRGDRLYQARDFDGALHEYQSGVTLAPAQPLVHLRIAEVLLQKGQHAEAEGALAAAARFANGERGVRARVAFLSALAREGQAPPERAVEAWQAYEKLAQESEPGSAAAADAQKADLPVKFYATTAATRKQAYVDRKKLEADYAEVRARIERTVDGANASMKTSK